MIEKIKSPDDIKNLDETGVAALAAEIRGTIIDTVSKNGGHLSSNLGIVEAVIVLHQVFSTPKDSILFDVGHQAYTHKLLTGRYEEFSTLRKLGGISGFVNREESEHDTFSVGHSGTALASAVGIAEANRLSGSDAWTVAVVGDGAMTNGMTLEALNNCADKNIRLIILINDNEMSISQNVGGISRHLANVRTSRGYFKIKNGVKRSFQKIPLIGKPVVKCAHSIKEFTKRALMNCNLFESFGLDYIGPIDSHDTARLRDALLQAKKGASPCVVHIMTKKGDGYMPAETEPDLYHSVSPFDTEKGVVPSGNNTFSDEFGRYMEELAADNKKICAVSAAMADGTGLKGFARKFPSRFFDVGIAEEYAVTFSAALASKEFRPVCALYSTFAQRAYDQVWHDAALQKLPLVLALDRCGIVPGDGCTHQGLFDYSLFSSIPGITIYSPRSFAELRSSMREALSGESLAIVRYPKGGEPTSCGIELSPISGGAEYNTASCDVLIVTYGRITENACRAAVLLRDRVSVGILEMTKIAPIDTETILGRMAGKKLVYILEEGVRSGSFAEKLAAGAAEAGLDVPIVLRTIDDQFLPHGSTEELMKLSRLDESSVADEITEALKRSKT